MSSSNASSPRKNNPSRNISSLSPSNQVMTTIIDGKSKKNPLSSTTSSLKQRHHLLSTRQGLQSSLIGDEINGTVKLNAKGGIFISREEIEAAFEMLRDDYDNGDDSNNNSNSNNNGNSNSGRINLATLKKKLGILFPELTYKDYKFLMSDQKYLNIDDLCSLLLENEVKNFDPVQEAFKSYDPLSSGYMDVSRLNEIFKVYGCGEVSAEEFEVLSRVLDTDGDGKLSLHDFRQLSEQPILPLSPRKKEYLIHQRDENRKQHH